MEGVSASYNWCIKPNDNLCNSSQLHPDFFVFRTNHVCMGTVVLFDVRCVLDLLPR